MAVRLLFGRRVWGPLSSQRFTTESLPSSGTRAYRRFFSAQPSSVSTYRPGDTDQNHPMFRSRFLIPPGPTSVSPHRLLNKSFPDLMAWTTAAYSARYRSGSGCAPRTGDFIAGSSFLYNDRRGTKEPGIAPLGVDAASNFAFVVVSEANNKRRLFRPVRAIANPNDSYLGHPFGGLPLVLQMKIHSTITTNPTGRNQRLLADQISREQGRTVVIENRPGAGDIIGTEYVARSAPDGSCHSDYDA